MQQLYRIDNIGLPNRLEKKRGDLYLFFNLIIHQNQKNMVVHDIGHGYIYPLQFAETQSILKSEETTHNSNSENLTIYPIDGIIITNQ